MRLFKINRTKTSIYNSSVFLNLIKYVYNDSMEYQFDGLFEAREFDIGIVLWTYILYEAFATLSFRWRHLTPDKWQTSFYGSWKTQVFHVFINNDKKDKHYIKTFKGYCLWKFIVLVLIKDYLNNFRITP